MQPAPGLPTKKPGYHPTSSAIAIAVAASAILLAATPGYAFKWSSCPMPPLQPLPSTLGATLTPFIQPQRDLIILLDQSEVDAGGGFSTAADGNQVAITFKAIFGTPITLAPRAVTATGPNALTLSFPDTVAETGRLLTGPVEIRVTTDGRTTALIDAEDLVALPPTVDVTDLLLGPDSERIVGAALAADGSLWVPLAFQGDPKAMPMCEGNFIYPVHLSISGALLVGACDRTFDPLRPGRPLSGYLADMTINGTNFYGLSIPQPIDLVRADGTLGVSICRLNDATSLVVRIAGDASWVTPKASPFTYVAADAAALQFVLLAPNPLPDSSGGATDSFGNPCIAGVSPSSSGTSTNSNH